ncbi:DUF115 domain-containing protein [Dasania sp. GY-MA-18]|uniref:DUF115 domain-containing protein n=1 Tax=Dasania phycosphaerae TaxID=2950436 RepID=A0A9J6RH61_9GAMM|nr:MULTISPECIES: 6-hydroxymethylpterin diphosphokinase MptE-like protein [Dasania]MCR8921368.1 DUF115 domain-containing protein [Dasania sp. GY-MA-18]MCZ0863796.1 DUF115 domain-containing protein [Dasania phycosphaerae]MCZ0867524.1 DUF115 domain-containing protein [Dasania phycosphaerae]
MSHQEPSLPLAITTNQFGEQYLPSINKNVFTSHGSKHAFQKQFKNELWETGTFHIIVGTDSGLLIKYIIEHGIPEDSRFLFIEPNSLIDTIKTLVPDLEQYSNQLILCTPDEWEEKTVDLDIDPYILDNTLRLTKSIAAFDPTLEEYERLNIEINNKLESTVYAIKITDTSARFISHQLKLISENYNPFYLLNGKFKNKTCIILGGGPSLDNHLPWIRDNKENLVIIAVSRIAKEILNAGIIPHMVFSVDPDIVSFDLAKKLFTLPEKVLFVYSNHANAELISQWHGKCAYLGPRYPWESKNEKENIMPHGPTVTNTALMAAVNIGFKRVLLAGVDLCYSKNGVTHTKGSEEADAGPFLSNEGQWVETYEGEKAFTDMQFVYATKLLKGQAEYAKENGTELINLSETAVKIKNIAHIKPENIEFEAVEDSIWDIIDKHIPSYCPTTNKSDNLTVIREIEKHINIIGEIESLAKDALKENQQLFKKNKDNEFNKKTNIKLAKIHKKLSEKYPSETALLQSYGSIFFREFIKPAVTEDWKEKELELSRNLYYNAIIESITEFRKLLKKTLKRTQSRVAEEKSPVDLSHSIKQWQEDGQPGRSKLWITRHQEEYKNLDEDTKKQLQDMVEDFEKILVTENMEWRNECKKSTSLDGVRAKLDKMMLQKNKEGLINMREALSQLKNQNEQAVSLQHLCSGYILAIEGKSQASLDELEKVLEEETQEQALKVMLTLSIDLLEKDKAETALERLSEKSQMFTPHYAEFLKLQNKYEKSIFTYTEYLKDYPDDIPVWFSLGKLYHEINEIELASMVFDHIIEHDPSNEAAQSYVEKIRQSTIS